MEIPDKADDTVAGATSTEAGLIMRELRKSTSILPHWASGTILQKFGSLCENVLEPLGLPGQQSAVGPEAWVLPLSSAPVDPPLERRAASRAMRLACTHGLLRRDPDHFVQIYERPWHLLTMEYLALPMAAATVVVYGYGTSWRLDASIAGACFAGSLLWERLLGGPFRDEAKASAAQTAGFILATLGIVASFIYLMGRHCIAELAYVPFESKFGYTLFTGALVRSSSRVPSPTPSRVPSRHQQAHFLRLATRIVTPTPQ